MYFFFRANGGLIRQRHQPAPPPDRPQGTLALGGRAGARAGAAL